MKKAFLALADGTVFEGISAGADGTALGEIVFTTGMVGYLETVTDPAFAGQIVTMTYPIIGNYGINRADCQSGKVQVKGMIMKEMATHPNNFRSEETLKDYLLSENVVAISGIDTRALTKIIRNQGAMNGVITTDENFKFENYKAQIEAYTVGALVSEVTCKEKYTVGSGALQVALIDYGVQKNIIESLVKRGATVTVYPATTKASDILADKPDGIMLSGGPGNPADYPGLIAEIKELLASGTPLFGTGLGHQMAAIAMGGKTEKLKFGHRGANQPVKDLAKDMTFATVQNCGYTVVKDSLEESVATVSHINVNDGTVEGIRYNGIPAFTVQYAPECKPGPKSMEYIFDEFMNLVGGKHNA